MLVTSVTTAAAFFANAASAIPAVRVFGCFVGTMVVVNYLLVITFFPACVLFWELRVREAEVRMYERLMGALEDRAPRAAKHIRDLTGGNTVTHDLLTGTVTSARSSAPMEMVGDDTAPPHAFDGGKKGSDEAAVAILEHYSEGILRVRHVLVGAFLVLSAVCFALSAQIQPSSDVPNLFPKEHNVQKFIDWGNDGFFTTAETSCSECYIEPPEPDHHDLCVVRIR